MADKKRKKSLVGYVYEGWHEDCYVEKDGMIGSYIPPVIFPYKHFKEGWKKVRITLEET